MPKHDRKKKLLKNAAPIITGLAGAVTGAVTGAATTTIVGTGATISAGAVSTVTTLAGIAAGVSFPLWILPAAGIGAAILGGLTTLYLKDSILKMVEKDAQSMNTSNKP